jgi:iron complex transport system substrate-binding protein
MPKFASLILLILASGIAHAGTEDVCLPAEDPSRVVVAGGSIAEMLYALDVGGLIVAVDSTAAYLPETSALPSVGYVRNLSAEGILALKPSLILGEHDMGPVEVLNQISNVEVEVKRIEERHSTQGIVDKFICIARVLDKEGAAREILKSQFAETVTSLGKANVTSADMPRAALILNFVDNQPIVAGANTSGDGLLRMAGAENVFSDIEGWKPLSRELLIAANPEHIVVTERALKSIGGLQGMLSDPLLASTDALNGDNVHAYGGMSLLGFGLQTLEVALSLKKAIE